MILLLFSSFPFQMPNIDPTYLVLDTRINTTNDTKIAAVTDQVDSWVDKRNYARIKEQEREAKEKGLVKMDLSKSIFTFLTITNTII